MAIAQATNENFLSLDFLLSRKSYRRNNFRVRHLAEKYLAYFIQFNKEKNLF